MSTVVASPTDRLALMAQRPGALWLDTSSSTGSAGPWTTIAAEPAVWILGRGEQLQIEHGPRGDRGWRSAMRAVDPRRRDRVQPPRDDLAQAEEQAD